MPEVTYDSPDKLPWYLKDNPVIPMLDLKNVLEDYSLHISIRNYAAVLIQGVVVNSEHQSYCSTGAFFQGMSGFMVADLFNIQQDFDDNYAEWIMSNDFVINSKLRNLTTLTFLLARGEGVPDVCSAVLQEGLPKLCQLIRNESKHRKGIIKGVPNYRSYYLLS
jgi:hypothetical protein